MINKHDMYQKIKTRGFNPKVVVDGGYGIGEWTNFIRSIFPEVKVLAAEPNENAVRAKQEENLIIENLLFWSEDNKPVPFYKNLNSSGWCTGDSAFRELSHHYGENNSIVEYINTITINSMAKLHNIEKIDLIKLDVQGAELECLRGTSHYLDMVDFVELECAIVNYNEGAPTIYDIFDFMKPHFEVLDILQLHRANTDVYGDLIQADILFVNKNCSIKKVY